jgi:predicted component of type VI protein secretion system
MAELVLRLRDREMSRVPILSTRFTVGRDTGSDLVIDNAGVSRTHALVTFQDNTYSVEDAGSQNGITLNGKRVKQAELQYGDVIGIGKFEIEFLQSQDFPMSAGTSTDAPGAKNIMKTMQMSPEAAARIRDEAMARIAASKGQAAPAPTVSGRPAAARRPATAPASAPAPANDVTAVLKIVAMVLLAVFGIGGTILFLLSR